MKNQTFYLRARGASFKVGFTAKTAQDLAVGRLESPVRAAELAPAPLGAQEGPDGRAVHRRHRQRAALRHHTQPGGRHRPAPRLPGAVHHMLLVTYPWSLLD